MTDRYYWIDITFNFLLLFYWAMRQRFWTFKPSPPYPRIWSPSNEHKVYKFSMYELSLIGRQDPPMKTSKKDSNSSKFWSWLTKWKHSCLLWRHQTWSRRKFATKNFFISVESCSTFEWMSDKELQKRTTKFWVKLSMKQGKGTVINAIVPLNINYFIESLQSY